MKLSDQIAALFSGLPRGVAKCVLTDCVCDALATLELIDWTSSQRLIAIRWPEPPRIDKAIDQVIDRLARAAQVAWPSWFGLDLSPRLTGSEAAGRVAELLAGDPARADLLLSWTEHAWDACRRDQLPQSEASNTVAARQLAAALDPGELTILLVVQSDSHAERLDGLARAAQWLATLGQARVALLLDRRLAQAAELASIDYEPLPWPGDRQASSPQTSLSETSPQQAAPADDEDKLIVWPLAGRPHPASPGEQLLARRLEQDDRLRGVFRFNYRVNTVHGSTYLVDLLAPSERIIIEIDGYRHHCSRAAFAADRHRDYELQTSGYLVLRIAHHELMSDTDFCLEKVRRMLDFRRRPTRTGG